MKFITDILEGLHINNVKCSICKHYLSVKPILANIENGQNICGRCQPPLTLHSRNYMYESLARQLTFPCMYLEKGCMNKSSFQTVATHESYCIHRTFTCHCSWSGTPNKLKLHYEKEHTDSIIRAGDSIILQDSWVQFLFINRCFQFLVSCEYGLNNYTIKIDALTNIDLQSKAVFTCRTLNSYLDFNIELNNILQLQPRFDELPAFSLYSKISSGFIQSVLISIVCPNCFSQMTPPILHCSEGHLTCVVCTDDFLNYCLVCDTQRTFTCSPELEYIATVSMFACKWKCGSEYSAFEIRNHEQACEKRLYDCWHGWSGYFNQLAMHDKACYPNGFNNFKGKCCRMIFNKKELTIYPKSGDQNFHFIIHNCSFNVTFCCTKGGKASGIITLTDFHMIGHFSFTVSLIHVKNLDCPNNKTYELQETRGVNKYVIDIPQDDILNFGKGRPFTVIIRVIPLNEDKVKTNMDFLYNHFINYGKML